MRDFQKSRVYKSENACTFYKWTQTIDNDDLQSWAEKNVLSKSWFRKRWGNRYPLIEKGRGGGRAYGGMFFRSRISLGVQCRNPWVMCHEIAHLVTKDHHGPEFVATFVFLIEKVVGKEQAAELEAQMYRNGVKMVPQSRLPKPSQNPEPYKFTKKARSVRRIKPKNTNPRVQARAARTGITRNEGKMKIVVKNIKATEDNGWSWETVIERDGKDAEVREYKTGPDRKGLFRYVSNTWAPVSEDFLVKGRNSVYGKAKRLAQKEFSHESN